MNKEKFILEFVFDSCSHSVLWKAVSTPDGLGEWFADEVRTYDENWGFVWNGIEQLAKRLFYRDKQQVRFRWNEETNDTYFELKITEDPLTGSVTLTITDFADEDEVEDAKLVWEKQVETLSRRLGAC